MGGKEAGVRGALHPSTPRFYVPDIMVRVQMDDIITDLRHMLITFAQRDS